MIGIIDTEATSALEENDPPYVVIDGPKRWIGR